jgi:triacylglycerol lipase
MQPGSHFLRELNRDLDQLRQIQLTSLWTPFDLLVVPAVSGRLPLGDARRLWVSSHNNMLRDQQSLKAIIDALSTPA